MGEPTRAITHGRHCVCSACAREDWTRPDLGPCGMHGEKCPPVYAPIRPAEPTISLRERRVLLVEAIRGHSISDEQAGKLIRAWDALVEVREAAREITFFACGEPGWPLHDAKLALREKLDRFTVEVSS